MHASNITRICAALLLLPLLSATGFAQQFSATPTLGSRPKPFGFMPIRANLETQVPFKGQISAHVENDPQTHTSLRIAVGPGRFRYEMPVRIEEGSREVIVTLTDHMGRVRAKRKMDVSTPQNSIHDPARQGLLIGWAQGRANYDVHSFFGLTCNVNPLDISLMPRDRRLYDAIDCLVLPGADAARLSDEKVEAVVSWVKAGGKLVVDSAGTEQEQFRNLLLPRLGIELGKDTRTIQANRDTMIHTGYGAVTNQQVSLTFKLRDISAGNVTCRDILTLSKEIPYGLGQLVITCIDLEHFVRNNSTSGCDAALFQIITDTTFRKVNNRPRFYYSNGLAQWEEAAARMNGIAKIPALLIALYLLLFIIIACPLERIVLRRIDRAGWTWVATGAMVIVFCVSANLVSLLARGTHSHRSMICFHDYAIGGNGKHTLLDCHIGARTRTIIAEGESDDLLIDLSGVSRNSSGVHDLRSNRLEFSSPVWAPHFILSSRLHQEQTPFKNDLRVDRDMLSGSITPTDAGMVLHNVTITWNDRLYRLERHGESWMVSCKSNSCMEIADLPLVKKQDTHSLPDNDDDIVKTIMELAVVMSSSSKTRSNYDSFFLPASIPCMTATKTHAIVIAQSDDGASLNIKSGKTKTHELHIVRQIMKVSEQ